MEGKSGGSFWDRLNSLGREYAVLQPGTTVLCGLGRIQGFVPSVKDQNEASLYMSVFPDAVGKCLYLIL